MPRLFAELETQTPIDLYRGKIGEIEPLRLDGGQQVNFTAQFRKCGKESCSSCPHGPYAYAVIGSGSTKRRVYLGVLDTESRLAPPRPKAKRRR